MEHPSKTAASIKEAIRVAYAGGRTDVGKRLEAVLERLGERERGSQIEATDYLDRRSGER